MANDDKKEGLNRRGFLAGATAAGLAAVPLSKTSRVEAQDSDGASAPLPNAMDAAMEHDIPEGYSDEQAANYFVHHPGSDYMVDVLAALDLDYVALNPGSAFRGFHESILNHSGNRKPEILTCVHEEHAAAIAHGYAKVAKKPMAIACHGTVGIQHAAMAVYNAYADRVPMFILAADHGGIEDRTSQVLWTHTARDPLSPIKDYIKWDDYPRSLQHFGESAVRAYRFSLTPPMGPVGIIMETVLQEADVHEHGLSIPEVLAPTRPLGDPNAIEEAADWLANAESPVIYADRFAQDQEGVDLLVELAELLQAPVVDQKGRMNFPNGHHLSQTAGVVAQADVILALEVRDLFRNRKPDSGRARPHADPCGAAGCSRHQPGYDRGELRLELSGLHALLPCGPADCRRCSGDRSLSDRSASRTHQQSEGFADRRSQRSLGDRPTHRDGRRASKPRVTPGMRLRSARPE